MTNKDRHRRVLHLSFFLIFSLILFGAVAWGQTAQIVGTITDASGARVPGTRITVTNVKTGLQRIVSSNSNGYYTAPLLPPGQYSMTAQKAGFKVASRSGIVLSVGNSPAINFTLTVGAVSQSVSVKAAAPLLNTQNATIKEVVGAERMVGLPLNGRDITQLLTLQAGVIQTENSPGIVGNGFVSNGTRYNGVTYFLNGGYNQNSYQNFSGEFPNPDAIQEFVVETNNYSAQYGNAPGAVVSVVTKSGTNQFHGSAFEFVRNGNLFDARNFFQPNTDSLKRNQFGGTFGGPVVKNKLFFFFSAQRTTNRSNPVLTEDFLPTAAERAGDFAAISKPIKDPLTGAPFPGNQIPPSDLSPVTLAFLKYYPVPSNANGLIFVGTPTIQNEQEYTGKGDWDLGRHRITGTYYYSRYLQPFTGNTQDYATMNASTVGKSTQPYSLLVLSDTYSLSSSMLNVVTFSDRRDEQFNDWDGVHLPLNYQGAGVQNIALSNPPEVYIDVSGGFLTRPGWDYLLHEDDLNWADMLTWMHGRHEFKFGGEFIRTTNTIANHFRQQGMFTFNGSISGDAMADFMLGDVYQFWQGGGEYKDYMQNRPGFFAEDSFRATPKLTLNLGLRWDPELLPTDSLGRVECFVPGAQSTRYPNAPKGYLLAGDAGCPSGGFNTYWPDLAPRFGFAYQLGHHTAVRGGFGLFWDPLTADNYNTFVDSAPFSPQVVNYGVSFQNPYAGVVNPFPQDFAPFLPPQDSAFEVPLGTFGTFAPNYRPSYHDDLNLTVEHELTPNWLVSASYIGDFARFLDYVVDQNYARYEPGATLANLQSRRPYPDFEEVTNAMSGSTSSYNALQLNAEHRFAKNLTFNANYTYSKSIDEFSAEDSSPGQSTPLIPTSLSANRGDSDFDVTNRFVASYVWGLPTPPGNRLVRDSLGGWETTGIVTLQSGFPFSVLTGGDNSLSGDGIDYADLVGNPNLSTSRPTGQFVQEYFNTAAFAENTLGTFGNAPRNFLRRPGYADFDLGFMRNFAVKERVKLQFRAEFFNMFNRPNFDSVNSTLSSAGFGEINGAGSPRIIQFALKLSF
ncbi:MAG: carboxypeptidase regulatory-like domain-containing protein [Terriglobia bacterium]